MGYPGPVADAIESRLHRIEGHVRALGEMVEDGRDCSDLITAISQIKGGLDAVALLLLHDHSLQCFREIAAAEPERQEQALRRLGRVHRRFARS